MGVPTIGASPRWSVLRVTVTVAVAVERYRPCGLVGTSGFNTEKGKQATRDRGSHLFPSPVSSELATPSTSSVPLLITGLGMRLRLRLRSTFILPGYSTFSIRRSILWVVVGSGLVATSNLQARPGGPESTSGPVTLHRTAGVDSMIPLASPRLSRKYRAGKPFRWKHGPGR